ncbi:DUF1707 domain-containing protein [Actinocorallia sp. API 0066]|uniref:DUF1707 SHOCT-like domain-containing protein n=1 Tax=Actinocorallia sp. API 0066 TaxID=2896846 RepID=UPI001E491902|nr:DUF1707 domain-containing protein [Actinocorallia sp. API 0066]MCD0452004.1 DUF1707 domain-containing protein [Actinocorallia sp. API 0066]
MSRHDRHNAHRLAHEARKAALLASQAAMNTAFQGRQPSAPNAAHLRIGDAERNAVAEALQNHYAEGRLEPEELDDRITRALAAKTQADLAGVLDDLPGPHPWEAVVPQAPGYRPRERGRGPNRPAFALWLFLLVGFPLLFFAGGWAAAAIAGRVLIIGGLIFLAVRILRGRSGCGHGGHRG